MRRFFALAALLFVSAGPARASEADWPLLAVARDGDCRLEVTGNGQIFLIAATGLLPGEGGRYSVTNGDMKPIDWRIAASQGGRFARFYMPFRWHRDGGTLAVAVDTDSCRVSAVLPWRRAVPHVIE